TTPHYWIGDFMENVTSNFITYYQTHLDGGSCTTNEWDSDEDCNPDTFYNADNGYELVDQLMAAFQSILRRTASGTAASVVAGEESGEGAVYQATFYQTYQDDEGTEINWIIFGRRRRLGQ
ncbi:MAG: hypothetical protein JSW36_12085, partial [Burkholderiales bacterium]